MGDNGAADNDGATVSSVTTVASETTSGTTVTTTHISKVSAITISLFLLLKIMTDAHQNFPEPKVTPLNYGNC